MTKLAEVRKAIAAALGSLLTVLVLVGPFANFIPGAHVTIGVLVAILTPIITWAVPNSLPTTTSGA